MMFILLVFTITPRVPVLTEFVKGSILGAITMVGMLKLLACTGPTEKSVQEGVANGITLVQSSLLSKVWQILTTDHCAIQKGNCDPHKNHKAFRNLIYKTF